MTTHLKQRLHSLLILVIVSLLAACNSVPAIPYALSPVISNKQCVVLVHGLWRSGVAMNSIADDLNEFDYQTVSISYPSTSMSIPEIAERYLPPAIDECKQGGAEQIHLVSHSMGGIVVRQYLQNNHLPSGSKVVMLSPPNQGSELSEKFGNEGWYQQIVGPAGASLTKKESGIISTLRTIEEPVGIIAAYRNWSVWPSTWLPEPNDGTVSVASMMLDEMDDFVLINSGHAMIRFNDASQEQIRYFLSKGEFYHAQNEAVLKDSLPLAIVGSAAR
jgi:pimeloyl-ACP methyl ester carboxylesterase